MNIQQFEIWNIDLNPTKGSEQKGIRPCVILQTNAMNNHCSIILVAPLTSKKLDKIYPYEIKLAPTNTNGLESDSKINCGSSESCR